MPEYTQFLSAFLLGLSGAGHCLGMCGGITAAMQLSGGKSRYNMFAFHGARIASYALLGMVAGLITSTVDTSWAIIVLRYLASLFLIAMGLYVGEWWRGLATIEQAGAAVFQPVQKFLSSLPTGSPLLSSVLLGLCWAVMPCGLIYSALAWSATTQHPGSAALLMLTFGAGTLPSMLAISLGAERVQQLLRHNSLKRFIAVLLIAAGVWTAYAASQHGEHSSHREHGAAQKHSAH